ncbi:hypothetical protein [Paenisporosarcina cavernae]|uniref:Uncharacterized protein n=1 Tax=Paenisporosarcina cavernae TaxID=2320858 RepID=A0A385YYT3_9BACL|nr:hypothetical protein [Paenisporosarcina cavernae]AYC30512.1 hypothetical protein D3873_11965 [Paenisporosarcina cavernae]
MRKEMHLLLVLVVLTGCSNNFTKTETTYVFGNPDADEMLEMDPDVDMFQWNDGIYVTDIAWVNALEIEIDQEVGTITNQSYDPEAFANGTSTKLPIGSVIFSVKDQSNILIVKDGEKLIRYLHLVEG